jgi:transglycosylase-like protein with SLT domain
MALWMRSVAVTPAPAVRDSWQAGRVSRHQGGPGFGHVLADAMARAQGRPTGAAAPSAIRTAALHMPIAIPRATQAEKPVSIIPAQSDTALQQAMAAEAVPQSWRPALQFIMAQESAGQVDARNPVHSARGLFQLTRANYHLNPNGARSFGNAVEEAQGGIRYIQQRYGTADNAVAFWRQHRWY